MQNLFDKIIFVSAPFDIRLERLMKRNNFTKEQALVRISAQQDEIDKIEKSDFVINNNSDLENLKQLTIKTIEQLN
jgi:dephospho-CoA kinase